MLKKMFAILDEKSKAFLTPFFSDNAATAARMLESSVADKNSFFGMFPADYSVYCVGEFDSSTGKVVPLEVKEYCFRLADLVRTKQAVVPLEVPSKGGNA